MIGVSLEGSRLARPTIDWDRTAFSSPKNIDLFFIAFILFFASDLISFVCSLPFCSIAADALQGMKRKWEGFTGVPLPKKLKTSSDAADASASASSAPAVASSVVPPAATLPCAETNEANNESIGKENSNNVKVNNVEHDNTKTAIDDSAALKKPEVLAATNTKEATAPSTTKVDTRPTAAQSKQTTAASQQPPSPLPHHPHDDIDVDNLKWNDLRKIVKQHGLSTAGRKFELQERLRSHLEEERRVRLVEWNEVHGGGVVEEVVEEEVCDEVMEEEKKVEEN